MALMGGKGSTYSQVVSVVTGGKQKVAPKTSWTETKKILPGGRKPAPRVVRKPPAKPSHIITTPTPRVVTVSPRPAPKPTPTPQPSRRSVVYRAQPKPERRVVTGYPSTPTLRIGPTPSAVNVPPKLRVLPHTRAERNLVRAQEGHYRTWAEN